MNRIIGQLFNIMPQKIMWNSDNTSNTNLFSVFLYLYRVFLVLFAAMRSGINPILMKPVCDKTLNSMNF